MIFTLFTVVVFIAELIIAFALIKFLLRMDKNIIEINSTVVEANPKIESIVVLVKKISDQILELAPLGVRKFKMIRDRIIIVKLSGIIVSLLFLRFNMKSFRTLRKSKTFKMALKGLSMIQNMV